MSHLLSLSRRAALHGRRRPRGRGFEDGAAAIPVLGALFKDTYGLACGQGLFHVYFHMWVAICIGVFLSICSYMYGCMLCLYVSIYIHIFF